MEKFESVEQALECLCGFATSGYGQQCRTKYICDGDETVAAECCYHILSNLHVEHAVGQILLECVSCFHNKHGCSVRSLLCMILVWYRSYLSLKRQNIPSMEIREALDQLLDISLSVLDSVSVDVSSAFEISTGSVSHPVRDSVNGGRKVIPQNRLSQITSKGATLPGERKADPNVDDDDDDISWYFTSTSSVPTSSAGEMQALEAILSSAMHIDSSKTENNLNKRNTSPTTSKDTTRNDDLNVEDVSWYFTSETRNDTTSSAVDEDSKDDVGMANLLPISSGKTEPVEKYSSCAGTDDDDDDFADCFDSPEQSNTPSNDNQAPVDYINDIDWLNKALAAVKSQSKVSKLPGKQSNLYSTNLFTPSDYPLRPSSANNPSNIDENVLDPSRSAGQDFLAGSSTQLNKTLNNSILPNNATCVHQSPIKSSPSNKHSSKDQPSNDMQSVDLPSNDIRAVDQSSNDMQFGDLPSNITHSFDQSFNNTQTETPLPDKHSIKNILTGISRGNSLISRLLNKLVECLTQTSDRLLPDDLDLVNTVRCVGPLSSTSDVYSGHIVQASMESVQILFKHSTFQALLFQGDLTSTYVHIGYRNTIKFRKELTVDEMRAEAERQSWSDIASAAICKCGVSCVLMKGSCDTTLRANLLSNGVLVLEKVPYSVIKYISTHCNVPILHYADDIKQAYCCEVKVTAKRLSTCTKTASNLVNISLPDVSVVHSPATSVVLCSPVTEQAHILEEQFRHALSRLRHIADSRQCIYNLSLYMIAEKLCDHQDIQRSDGLLYVAAEHFSQELRSLAATNSTAGSSLHVDDTVSVTDAWKTALSAANYMSSWSYFVRTGVSQDGDR